MTEPMPTQVPPPPSLAPLPEDPDWTPPDTLAELKEEIAGG